MAEQKREFKVGDKLVLPEGCSCSEGNSGDVVTVSRIANDGPVSEDWDGISHLLCGWVLGTPTIDTLAVDDVVVSEGGFEYTVAAVVGRVVFLEGEDGHGDNWYTVKELKDSDWTVKGAEEEVTEVTMDDIAEKLGVPVEKLRIKKEAE